MMWHVVTDDVWVFRDSCNVYAVRGPAGMLIVDAGSGAWLAHVDELPAKPVALALTHYFRDHAAGAPAAARAGIPVFVPEHEAGILADPVRHLQARETYIIYDNLWDLFVPIEPTPVAGRLADYGVLELAGLEVEVIPLPGATVTQCGLGVTLNGKRQVFAGEAIHSPGRVPRVAPYQYNYNDLPGAPNAYLAVELLREQGAEALYPSLGEPMLSGIDDALDALQVSLRRLCAGRPGYLELLDRQAGPELTQVTEHVWKSNNAFATSWFVVSESGKCLAIDYGYSSFLSLPAYSYPARRRPMLHSLRGLREQAGVERIDAVLVSHFHDDHVCGIPLLQRVMGTECYASEAFAELLASPEGHAFPCNWPVACRIDGRLPLEETWVWEGIKFQFAPMSGHTRFASLIGFELDGRRFAHTGDQYFFIDLPVDPNAPIESFAGRRISQNHVYRNGALLDGYAQSTAWMMAWRPEIVLQGHQPTFVTDEAFFETIEAWTDEYAAMHEQAMPLGADEAHLNLDSWGGWIWPYRSVVGSGAAATVTATVRNPLPMAAELRVQLVGPEGWEGSSAVLQAGPREEVSAELTITPSGACERQPFALELTVNGQPYGQVTEGFLTSG